MTEKAIGDDLELRIAKLALKAGDVLVIKVDREISAATANALREEVMKVLPQDARVLVITKDIELSVIERGSGPSAQD